MAVSQVNSSNLMQLRVGMTRDEVLKAMGDPQRREAYGAMEFLIYRTSVERYVGTPEAEMFTPVAIRDGRVIGWGRNYYDTALRSKIDAEVTVRNR